MWIISSFASNLLVIGRFMRTIWKGAISFGLVNIPVGLYPATRSVDEVKLRMVRKSDLSPVKYKRVAESDGKEVVWEEIGKAYEYEKNQFVLIDDKDFESVRISSNQTVDIQEFVNLAEIDPMFFDQPYYLSPEKGGDKAYALLRDALKNSGKVGIAKVVIKTREHLAAVKPLDDVLVLELMHFPNELNDTNELRLPQGQQVGKKELAMAESLIEGMSGEWDPSKYHDEYKEGLRKVIEGKVTHGAAEPAPKSKSSKTQNVVDLVSILQQSLNQSKLKQKRSPEASRKKAA
ncbi:MAG: Ku protein [Verrucomicrobiales bacterium]|nr:Ku protein [Verrucomicrobiales bacterium]